MMISNPLLARVRQHSRMATLFRQAMPPTMPVVVQPMSVVPLSAQPVVATTASPLSAAPIINSRPAHLTVMAAPSLSVPESRHQPAGVPQLSAPLPPATTPVANTPVIASSAAPVDVNDEAHTWQRLQTIMRKHQEKQAQEDREGKSTPPPTPRSADRNSERRRAIDAPSAAVNRTAPPPVQRSGERPRSQVTYPEQGALPSPPVPTLSSPVVKDAIVQHTPTLDRGDSVGQTTEPGSESRQTPMGEQPLKPLSAALAPAADRAALAADPSSLPLAAPRSALLEPLIQQEETTKMTSPSTQVQRSPSERVSAEIAAVQGAPAQKTREGWITSADNGNDSSGSVQVPPSPGNFAPSISAEAVPQSTVSASEQLVGRFSPQAADANTDDLHTLPLDTILPVQKQPLPSPLSSEPLTPLVAMTPVPPLLDVAQQSANKATLQQLLAPVATAQPTASPVEVAAPRRARPRPESSDPAPAGSHAAVAIARLPDPSLEDKQAVVQRASQAQAPRPPSPIPTEIGPLPSDLWTLIGQLPPTLPPTSGVVAAPTQAQVLDGETPSTSVTHSHSPDSVSGHTVVAPATVVQPSTALDVVQRPFLPPAPSVAQGLALETPSANLSSGYSSVPMIRPIATTTVGRTASVTTAALAVQREVLASSGAGGQPDTTTTVASSETAEVDVERTPPSVDLDELARQVFAHLKARLRIEQERAYRR